MLTINFDCPVPFGAELLFGFPERTAPIFAVTLFADKDFAGAEFSAGSEHTDFIFHKFTSFVFLALTLRLCGLVTAVLVALERGKKSPCRLAFFNCSDCCCVSVYDFDFKLAFCHNKPVTEIKTTFFKKYALLFSRIFSIVVFHF